MTEWKPENNSGNAGGEFSPPPGAEIPPFTPSPPPYPPPYPPVKRKNKWAAALLSILFPGLGHFYAGAMQRGLFFMLLFVGNIVGIVFFAQAGIVPLIVLLSVLVPVVFFYSLFDALQTADRVNHGGFPYPPHISGFGGSDPFAPHGSTYRRSIGGSQIGIALIGIGALIFFATNKPQWLEKLIHSMGSIIGALILIGIGAFLFFQESRKNK